MEDHCQQPRAQQSHGGGATRRRARGAQTDWNPSGRSFACWECRGSTCCCRRRCCSGVGLPLSSSPLVVTALALQPCKPFPIPIAGLPSLLCSVEELPSSGGGASDGTLPLRWPAAPRRRICDRISCAPLGPSECARNRGV